MSISSAHSDYTVLFAQRQELFIQECLRKLFDAEVKLVVVNNTVSEWKEKYEASQKQVDVQNEMMKQAAASIEKMTVEGKNMNTDSENFRRRIGEYEARINELGAIERELRNQVELSNNRVRDLEKELVRQKEELQLMFDEAKIKQSIKKKVNTKSEVTEDNTF